MDLAELTKQKAALTAELEVLKAQFHRYEGALAVVSQLIEQESKPPTAPSAE